MDQLIISITDSSHLSAFVMLDLRQVLFDQFYALFF